MHHGKFVACRRGRRRRTCVVSDGARQPARSALANSGTKYHAKYATTCDSFSTMVTLFVLGS